VAHGQAKPLTRRGQNLTLTLACGLSLESE